MKRKTKIALCATAIAGGAAAFLAIGETMYRLVLDGKAVKNSKLLEEDKEFEEIFKTNPLTVQGTQWFETLGDCEQTIVSRSGETLHAYTILAEEPSDIWIICAHGYAVPPESNAAQAKKFHEAGYNVLMPSLGGHGNSECKFVSMGWYDRLDLCDWIDDICKGEPNARIVLYGVSMGGAAVMMTTGEELPDNVVCAVEDCGYTDVLEEFSVQIRQSLHLPRFPFINAADLVTYLHTGYRFAQASSLEQVKKSKTPTLFIHGEQDDFVPVYMLEKCFDAATCEKEKLIVEGARHGCSGLVAPELYFDTINSFIQKHLNAVAKGQAL